MKLFLDTEFNEHGGELISIALVAETEGKFFYRVLEMQEAPRSWVAQHVMPKLYHEPRLPRPTVQADLARWLNEFDSCEIMVDWPEDIKYFCELMIVGPGMCINTPRLTFTLMQDVRYESLNPHHALADALALRVWWMRQEKAK